MILYNITIKADLDIAQSLVSWVKAEYLPNVIQLEKVIDAKLFRLLNVDVEDGITYCLQLHFNDISDYNLFVAMDEAKLKSEIMSRYNDKMILFASVLSEE